jgi:hypothetical protein
LSFGEIQEPEVKLQEEAAMPQAGVVAPEAYNGQGKCNFFGADSIVFTITASMSST